MKAINKKRVWTTISAFFLVLLAILFFLLAGMNQKKAQHISIDDIHVVDVNRMIVSSNGKQVEEFSIYAIENFLELLKTCTNPIELGKMRVIDSYKVHLKVGEKVTSFSFYKNHSMPFMMNQNMVVQSYECRQMENFLARYK